MGGVLKDARVPKHPALGVRFRALLADERTQELRLEDSYADEDLQHGQQIEGLLVENPFLRDA